MLFNPYTAIVGNYSFEQDRKKGMIIDSYPHVARLQNFTYEGNRIRDYGSKATVWFCDFFIGRGPQAEPFNIVCNAFPVSTEYGKRRYPNVDRELMERYDVHEIPWNYYSNLLKCEPHPSFDICMLYWIYKDCGCIHPFDVFGFKFSHREATLFRAMCDGVLQ